MSDQVNAAVRDMLAEIKTGFPVHLQQINGEPCMGFIAACLRRWLGIPTREEIRTMILREIDADAAWHMAATGKTAETARRDFRIDRDVAIMSGHREDTRG